MKIEEEINPNALTSEMVVPINIVDAINKHWLTAYYTWAKTSLIRIANLRLRFGRVEKTTERIPLVCFSLPGILNAELDDSGAITVLPLAGVTLTDDEFTKVREHCNRMVACFKVNDEKAAVFAFFEKDVARDLHGKTPDDALKELGKLGYIKTESSSNKRFRRSSEYDSSDE